MLLLSQFACNALWQPAPGNFPGGGSGDMGLPPTVLLSSPEDETELIHSDILFLSGSISDPDSSLEQLSLSLISDLSGELDADFQFAGGGNFGGLVDLEVGEHTLTITVVDEFDHADSVSFAVTKLANRTPSTPEIILSPEDAVVGEELTVLFSTESVDPDGEEVFYSYNWFRND